MLTAQFLSFWFAAGLFGAQAGKTVIALFPTDKTCVCTVVLTSIPGVQMSERVEGEEIYQVFQEVRTGRALFRLWVGHRERTGELKLWRYGISVRGNFNSDDVEDYSWAGGDDTSESLYLLLSSPSGYRTIDIIATFASAWKQTHPSSKLEFELITGPLQLENITLERGQNGLILAANVTNRSGLVSARKSRNRPAGLRVREANFVSVP